MIIQEMVMVEINTQKNDIQTKPGCFSLLLVKPFASSAEQFFYLLTLP
jgi:hypothetical protein